jgi:hypothetical protein
MGEEPTRETEERGREIDQPRERWALAADRPIPTLMPAGEAALAGAVTAWPVLAPVGDISSRRELHRYELGDR